MSDVSESSMGNGIYDQGTWLDNQVVDNNNETPGVGDGQGGLACCDSRGRKELDTTE